MKKNPWLWIGVICLVIGTILACFFNIASDVPALVIAAFGLGAICVTTYKNAEKKGVGLIVCLVFCCIGGFCCAVAGLSQETTVQIGAAVIALVSLLIGILGPTIVKKLKNNETK